MLAHRRDHTPCTTFSEYVFPYRLQRQHAPLSYLVLYSEECTAEAVMARFTGKSFLREEHPVEKQNRMNKAKKKFLKLKIKKKISSHMLTLKIWMGIIQKHKDYL